MFEGILFVIATVIITTISRASLRAARSHGFYRFFAWELLVVLFLLNWRNWFTEPFALHQIVSWTLLLISLFLVVQGMDLLRRRGKPDDSRSDSPMIGMEKTTALVTTGIYHYIRHPLYSSLLCLGWGMFFKQPSWIGGILAAVVTILLMLTARAEEGENVRYFGTDYQTYMQHTKMFLPFLF